MKINGQMHSLWRAVDHEGEVLDSLASKARDKPAAMKKLGNAQKQDLGRWQHNRCENSHLPFRRRERAMLRFRQMESPQTISSVHAAFHNHFNQERHLTSRETLKAQRSAALAEWHSLMA